MRILKKYVLPCITLLAAALAISLIVVFASQSLTKRPFDAVLLKKAIEVDNRIVKLNLKIGEAREVVFHARNVSGGDLAIYGANTTCGCTVVENEFPQTVANGESLDIKVRVLVEPTYKGVTFLKNVTLLSNAKGSVPLLVISASVSGVDVSKGLAAV